MRKALDHLFSMRQCLENFYKAGLHIWVFVMELPGTPGAAWDAIQAVLEPIEDQSNANNAAFLLRAKCGVLSLRRRCMPSEKSGYDALRTLQFRTTLTPPGHELAYDERLRA